MKKYFVEVKITFTTKDGRDESTKLYECNDFAFAKNWTGNCIRLEDVNSVKISKSGKETRKQQSRGLYITVDCMSHWDANTVVVYDNETKKVVYKNN